MLRIASRVALKIRIIMAKELSEKKGTFRPWTPQSIEWYERASAYTRYHSRLAGLLLPYLRPEDRCCELACGTGTLARMLAPHVSRYTANDIDPDAIAHNRDLIGQVNDTHPGCMELVGGDWKEVLRGRQFDTVIFSFFGAIRRNWEELRAIAGRQIIAVTYGGEDRSGSGGRKSRQEHAEDIAEFLKERGIPFDTVSAELEFGQPLLDMEEARRYIRYYYPFDDAQTDAFLKDKLLHLDDGTLYFPKKKKLGIVAIREFNDAPRTGIRRRH